MILKKVHFPFLYLTFLVSIFVSCESNVINDSAYSIPFNKAKSYFDSLEYDSAFYYFQKTKLYSESQNDFVNIVRPLLLMSEIQRIKNDYSGSEETITEALKYINNNTEIKYQTFIYNNLGLSMLEQANYTEALKYYEKSLEITTDELSKCIIKNNIAYNYIKQKKYLEAKAILNSTKDNRTLQSKPIEYARIIDNLGYTLFKLNDSNSVNFLNQSKIIREKENDVYGLTATYMHLAEYYIEKDIIAAKKNAVMALEMTKKTKNIDDKIEALHFLTKISNDKDSKNFALESFRLSDSIQIARHRTKNQFAKIKYDSRESLKEIKKQKQLKEFSIIGIILLLGISIYSYSRIKRRNQKKIKETAYQTETRIAKKLHDELANDVHNTIAFAETQELNNPQNKNTLLESLETIYNRTRNISSENKDIDTGESYLEKLVYMLTNYNSPDRNIIVKTDGFNHSKVSKEIKVVIFRVLQELMVNMKKHSRCSLVSISIKSDKKSIQLNYSDNGIGTNNQLNFKNGLLNVENRIHSVNGKINFDTAPDKGFKVKIEIPK